MILNNFSFSALWRFVNKEVAHRLYQLIGMIIIEIKGGLGNQMFQYALGKHLSLKRGVELKFDLRYLQEKQRETEHVKRDFELNKFNIKTGIATEVDLKIVEGRKNKFDFLLPYYKRTIVKEKTKKFDKKIFLTSDNSLLKGYWQSEKYFQDIESILRKDFIFCKEYDEDYFLQMKKKIETTNSVSLHFRRGDYINDPIANKYHGVCSLEYYLKSIQTIASKIECPEFFVFSDEIQWVKNNLKTDLPIHFIENSCEESHSDFRLMSICKHNIIANSSYSWWAAWLNANRKKIVIVPQKWFATPRLQSKTNDLIPNEWIKM